MVRAARTGLLRVSHLHVRKSHGSGSPHLLQATRASSCITRRSSSACSSGDLWQIDHVEFDLQSAGLIDCLAEGRASKSVSCGLILCLKPRSRRGQGAVQGSGKQVIDRSVLTLSPHFWKHSRWRAKNGARKRKYRATAETEGGGTPGDEATACFTIARQPGQPGCRAAWLKGKVPSR